MTHAPQSPRPAAASRTARAPGGRPYGRWYHLARTGHFLLMATASCVINLVILVLIVVVALLIYTLTK